MQAPKGADECGPIAFCYPCGSSTGVAILSFGGHLSDCLTAAGLMAAQGRQGGFGAIMLHDLAGDGLLDGHLAVRTMTLPDRFIDKASSDAMYADAGLSVTDIAVTALQAVNVNPKNVTALNG